jgi:hypothetical protein
MPRTEFELATPATKQPQTYALDRAATGIGISKVQWTQNNCELGNVTVKRGKRIRARGSAMAKFEHV